MQQSCQSLIHHLCDCQLSYSPVNIHRSLGQALCVFWVIGYSHRLYSLSWFRSYVTDFHKIGGFSILKPLQDSDDVELRWRCGDLIAALCQNNPYCQQKILDETDQLDRLMAYIESKDEPAIVNVKAVYALSGNYIDFISLWVII